MFRSTIYVLRAKPLDGSLWHIEQHPRKISISHWLSTSSKMKLLGKEIPDTRLTEWKALVAGGMVFGSMIYGYSALRENAELNIQKPPTSKAVRNERLMRMASRSCIGGLKISAFLTSYLAFDFGLEYLRNSKDSDTLNKVGSGAITGLIFSLRGGPAVGLQGSIIGAGLSYALVMAKDTFRMIDEELEKKLEKKEQ